MAGFYHNSRLPFYKDPVGAVQCGSRVRIRLGAPLESSRSTCMLWLSMDGASNVVLMSYSYPRKAFEGQFTAPETTGFLYYYFVVNDGKGLTYYSGSAGSGWECEAEPEQQFRMTVYERGYETPEWFRRSVAYQIFPDRFARDSARGGLEHPGTVNMKGRPFKTHEDWYEQPLYTPVDGSKYYSPCDYYGGDLRGIEQKLDYLKELGISCIYLNPIFEAFSNHRYNTSDYMKIDDVLGDENDFKSLCASAEAKGIRIILDGVFSHTGDDSLYFDRYSRHPECKGAYESQNSEYYSWYSFSAYPSSYTCWWGFDTLPEVNELNKSYVDFIVSGENSVIKHWLRDGASGWRLDVADELPEEFIRLIRAAIKQEKPDGVLLGEVWEDAATKFSMGVQRKYVMGKELDSQMNYPFADVVKNFLRGGISAQTARETLLVLRENQPEQFFYAALNLLGSHDVPRILSLLGGAPDKDSGMTREQQAKYQLTPRQYELAVKRLKLAVAMQMTYPGVPCVYYGDEAGLAGLMDPFNRAAYPWGRENAELLAYYRQVIALRNSVEALISGRLVVYAPDEDVLVVLRFDNSDSKNRVLTLINRAGDDKPVTLDLINQAEGHDAGNLKSVAGSYTDALSGAKLCIPESGILCCDIPPLTARIFIIDG